VAAVAVLLEEAVGVDVAVGVGVAVGELELENSPGKGQTIVSEQRK